MATSLLIRDVPENIRTWVKSESEQKVVSQQHFVVSLLRDAYTSGKGPTLFDNVPERPPTAAARVPFTFIDLFAGIGGLRIGLEAAGGRCVFSSEKDKFCQKTYQTWFGEMPHGDITAILPADIPDHDVMAAGFPCQPFSIAGVSKKKSLGKAHGFKDATQGTLFFHLATIVQVKRPPVLLLENVKNLRSHDGGKTWSVIRSTLEELDYVFFDKIIDAADYVPQHRERIIIVCFDKRVFGENPPFQFPNAPTGPEPKFRDILDPNPDPRYTLTDHLWNYLQRYAEKHREKGNGFGFGLTNLDGVSRTLSARYYKDGSEVLIPQSGKNPRRLTPHECARLMGFPDGLPIVVSDTQAYRQFGNAVVPKVSQPVAEEIVKVLQWQLTRHPNGCLLKRGEDAKWQGRQRNGRLKTH